MKKIFMAYRCIMMASLFAYAPDFIWSIHFPAMKFRPAHRIT